MKLIYNESERRFELISKFDDRYIPKDAGFGWEPRIRRWICYKVEKAYKLIEYADEACAKRIRSVIERREEAVADSRATEADIDIPCPNGQEFMPFQLAGINYALKRRHCLIADEMGLGKTIQAIGIANTLSDTSRVLVISPARLKLNWKRECEKWLTHDWRVDILDSKKLTHSDANVVIVNYDILHGKKEKKLDEKGNPIKKHGRFVWIYHLRESLQWMLDVDWDLVIVDEAHYMKNWQAKRTRCAVQLLWKGQRRILLTGTPILNKPREIYNLLKSLNAYVAKDWQKFHERYCGPRDVWTGRGYITTYDGATNLDELQTLCRQQVMVRRLKNDVLTELPPKRRQLVVFPQNGLASKLKEDIGALNDLLEEEKDIIAEMQKALEGGDEETYKEAARALESLDGIAFTEMSALRHKTALVKVPAVIEHCQEMLSEEQKIVIFAHHRDVVKQISDGLAEYNPRLIQGGMTNEKVEEGKEEFQDMDSDCRVMICNIQAGGLGHTLTAARVVVFAELDWVPANITQAEDRLHRIGQVDTVLVQHLVIEGTLDGRFVEMVLEKQTIYDQALDDTTKAELHPAEFDGAGDKLEEVEVKPVPNFTEEQLKAIHAVVKFLAYRCDGARVKDMTGYNKIDTYRGRQMAALPDLLPWQAASAKQMVIKYHKQIPDDLWEAMHQKVEQKKSKNGRVLFDF